MHQEISRQLIHLSGVLFIIMAQIIGEVIIVYFFITAFFFLFYSEYVRLEQKRINKVIDYMESKLRGIATGMERKFVKRQFMGAFWFYAGCGLTFLIFPFQIATIACIILSISDSLSTLIGHRYGKHNLLGNKSIEGTLAFFITSIIITSFLLDFYIGITASIIATAAELIPDIKLFEKLKASHILDDNYLIPLLSAAAIYIIIVL